MPNPGQITARGERTRERIIDAAAKLVFLNGLAATTLDEVKAAAGVGPSQLYHHFDGKDDLLRAIVARHTETIVAHQESDLRRLESIAALRAWAQFVVDMHRSFDCRGGCPIGSLGAELADRDETARAVISASLVRWEAALHAGLTRLRDTGVLRPDADPGALAVSLIVTMQGGLLLGKIHHSDRPLHSALTTAIDHVETYAVTGTAAAA